MEKYETAEQVVNNPYDQVWARDAVLRLLSPGQQQILVEAWNEEVDARARRRAEFDAEMEQVGRTTRRDS